MAYVTPATEVYLIKNCPLDVGREHTYLFANEEAQIDYFHDNSRATHHWGDYVRINPLDNTIRLGLPYKDVYQCNYVSFRNASTLQEQKWYYAFIIECNYINEGTTEIVFSLDYMQTYLFEFAMSPCMIEREHTKTDAVGDNIVPEGLDIGEYVLNSNHKTGGGTVLNPAGYIPCNMGNNIVYIIITSRDLIGHYTQGAPWNDLTIFYPVGNMYSGVGVYVIEDATSLGEVLTDMATQTDSIAAVFPFPAALINWNCVHWGTNQAYPIVKKIGRLYDDNINGNSVKNRRLIDAVSYTDGSGNTVNVRSSLTIPLFKNEAIDGYTPWNNKMFTAPFCWICLDSKAGAQGEFRPELFTSNINFGFLTAPSAEPQIFAYPINYRGMANNYEEGIIKSDAYPYCAYQYDNYKIWLQQNRSSLALSFAMGAVNGVASAASAAIGRTATTSTTKTVSGEIPTVIRARDERGRFTGGYTYEGKSVNRIETTKRISQYNTNPAEIARGFANGFASCAGVLSNMYDHSMIPNSIRGQVNNGNINQANELNDFHIYIKTVRADYAQKIDDFFSRYGYAVNKFGMPGVLDQTDGTIVAPSAAPRPRWNYVKTIDCKVHGWSTKSFNHDVEENLESIFNNGITFWNPSVTMYDYTQTAQTNNKPTV